MKKKKDGLIKGMIAAAIIFVVGFILTVCFGAYLGADAVRHIASAHCRGPQQRGLVLLSVPIKSKPPAMPEVLIYGAQES